MNEQIKKSILRTISYSDIFDYPLTKIEIWKFLIGSEKIKREDFDKTLKKISSIIFRNKFYCLPNRTQIVDKRLKREKESRRKFKIAQRAASFLSIIPTIYLIGLSGSLSMENSDENDDIDFFIIVKKNSIWTTRLISLFILQMLGKRRKRGDIKFKNKICINMIIDDFSMKMTKDRQNLYTAHEVVQLMPLFERQNMHSKFISANKWVRRYLPNASTRGNTRNNMRNYAESIFSIILRPVLRFSALEFLAKKLQLLSIKRHQTIETVDDHLLAFHPIDYRDKVMKEYNKRLKKYKI